MMGVHPFCLLKGHINKWQTRSTLSVKPILNMNITVMLTIRQLHLKNHNLIQITSMQNWWFKKLRLTWESMVNSCHIYTIHPYGATHALILCTLPSLYWLTLRSVDLALTTSPSQLHAMHTYQSKLFCFDQRAIFIDNIRHWFRDQSDLIFESINSCILDQS